MSVLLPVCMSDNIYMSVCLSVVPCISVCLLACLHVCMSASARCGLHLHSVVYRFVSLFHCLIVSSVRDGDTVKHYRIRQLDEGGFFIARRVTFLTLANLVEHYSQEADGLCVNLKKPCSQVREYRVFTDAYKYTRDN